MAVGSRNFEQVLVNARLVAIAALVLAAGYLLGTRGSNLTAEQLAHAGQFGCGTILPNGTPAVPCAKGQTCVERAGCTCQQDSDCTRTGVNCDHPGCLNGFCSCVPI